MKNHLFLAKLAVFGMLFFPVNANAQAEIQGFLLTVNTPKIIAQSMSAQEGRELETLRKEREVRNLVQAEVDRAFSHTTTLINILILVIILFPVSMVLSLWLLRRSIINQLVTEIKLELQTEREKQIAAFQQEIKQWMREYITYFSQLQTSTNTHPDVADNYVSQSSENQQIVNSEITDFIPEAAQTSMPQYQNENFHLNDNENTVAPELECNETQTLTFEDYLNLGNSYLAKSRYQEAIDAYNAALKIERNSAEVRYQNAKAYALRGSINPAIGNLQWAIDLDPEYKHIAQTDPAFAYIRNDEQFQQLVND
ncbi:tetratricopeptide repeat protein [Phormidium sp. LEGE 05292]|uniref:tetratricopeptide repeat protein n=1 Tax=[Phormidium] sp. LEGE 05292 TaxID=767427 RepID=UPI0018829C68|nr:tetratricopeptide repeat protein [Phormidium sp. LEGE 05292]MBE9225284.1 tetratricopeptide repeat protein [Phormidium sp. LEGE 05292]